MIMNTEAMKKGFEAWFSENYRRNLLHFSAYCKCERAYKEGYQQVLKDMNDNQLRGLPADIDLLIHAAEAVVRKNDTRRILHLESVVERVRPQYDELFKERS